MQNSTGDSIDSPFSRRLSQPTLDQRSGDDIGNVTSNLLQRSTMVSENGDDEDPRGSSPSLSTRSKFRAAVNATTVQPSRPSPQVNSKFKAVVHAIIARNTATEERGLGEKPLSRFITRICEQLDPELIDAAVSVLSKIGNKMEESDFEAMKTFARDSLKIYCLEMNKGLNILTVLAFAASFAEKKTELLDERLEMRWGVMTNMYESLSKVHLSILKMMKEEELPGRVYICSEDEFRNGILFKRKRDIRSHSWTKRKFKLDPRRGQYYGKTPWQYVFVTYAVLFGTLVIAGALIAWWNKPRAEGIFEALQVVPLIDLFYFGIWKVFSYNDKIVRDLITGRWTINSVEDFQRYFDMSEKEMFERIIRGDEELCSRIESRYASYSPKPLIGLLPLNKPCASAWFSEWFSHFVVNDTEFVVDWVNERIGMFHTLTSGYGRITWIYIKGQGGLFSSQAPFRRHPMRYLDIYAKTIVIERELRDVCDYIS